MPQSGWRNSSSAGFSWEYPEAVSFGIPAPGLSLAIMAFVEAGLGASGQCLSFPGRTLHTLSCGGSHWVPPLMVSEGVRGQSREAVWSRGWDSSPCLAMAAPDFDKRRTHSWVSSDLRLCWAVTRLWLSVCHTGGSPETGDVPLSPVCPRLIWRPA